MAKYGKFVSTKGLQKFNEREIAKLKKVMENTFRWNGVPKIITPIDNSEGVFFQVVLNNDLKEQKKIIKNQRNQKDYIYGLDCLTVVFYKDKGQIEKAIGEYEGKPFVQYQFFAWTNGRYHTYRKQRKHDFRFEGKDHFNYDTDINEFVYDLTNWKTNVWRGLP